MACQNLTSELSDKALKRCTCCPHGYHIDVDFVDFAQEVNIGHHCLNKIPRYRGLLSKSGSIPGSSVSSITCLDETDISPVGPVLSPRPPSILDIGLQKSRLSSTLPPNIPLQSPSSFPTKSFQNSPSSSASHSTHEWLYIDFEKHFTILEELYHYLRFDLRRLAWDLRYQKLTSSEQPETEENTKELRDYFRVTQDQTLRNLSIILENKCDFTERLQFLLFLLNSISVYFRTFTTASRLLNLLLQQFMINIHLISHAINISSFPFNEKQDSTDELQYHIMKSSLPTATVSTITTSDKVDINLEDKGCDPIDSYVQHQISHEELTDLQDLSASLNANDENKMQVSLRRDIEEAQISLSTSKVVFSSRKTIHKPVSFRIHKPLTEDGLHHEEEVEDLEVSHPKSEETQTVWGGGQPFCESLVTSDENFSYSQKEVGNTFHCEENIEDCLSFHMETERPDHSGIFIKNAPHSPPGSSSGNFELERSTEVNSTSRLTSRSSIKKIARYSNSKWMSLSYLTEKRTIECGTMTDFNESFIGFQQPPVHESSNSGDSGLPETYERTFMEVCCKESSTNTASQATQMDPVSILSRDTEHTMLVHITEKLSEIDVVSQKLRGSAFIDCTTQSSPESKCSSKSTVFDVGWKEVCTNTEFQHLFIYCDSWGMHEYENVDKSISTDTMHAQVSSESKISLEPPLVSSFALTDNSITQSHLSEQSLKHTCILKSQTVSYLPSVSFREIYSSDNSTSTDVHVMSTHTQTSRNLARDQSVNTDTRDRLSTIEGESEFCLENKSSPENIHFTSAMKEHSSCDSESQTFSENTVMSSSHEVVLKSWDKSIHKSLEHFRFVSQMTYHDCHLTDGSHDPLHVRAMTVNETNSSSFDCSSSETDTRGLLARLAIDEEVQSYSLLQTISVGTSPISSLYEVAESSSTQTMNEDMMSAVSKYETRHDDEFCSNQLLQDVVNHTHEGHTLPIMHSQETEARVMDYMDCSIAMNCEYLTSECMSSLVERGIPIDNLSFHDISYKNRRVLMESEVPKYHSISLDNVGTAWTLKDERKIQSAYEELDYDISSSEDMIKKGDKLSRVDESSTQEMTKEELFVAINLNSLSTNKRECKVESEICNRDSDTMPDSTYVITQGDHTEHISDINESFYVNWKRDGSTTFELQPRPFCSVLIDNEGNNIGNIDKCTGECIITSTENFGVQHISAQRYSDISISEDRSTVSSFYNKSSFYETSQWDSSFIVCQKSITKEVAFCREDREIHSDGASFFKISRKEISTQDEGRPHSAGEDGAIAYIEEISSYVVEKKDRHIVMDPECLFIESGSSEDKVNILIDGMSQIDVPRQDREITMETSSQKYCSILLDNSGTDYAIVDKCVGECEIASTANVKLQYSPVQTNQETEILEEMTNLQEAKLFCIDKSSYFEPSKKHSCISVNQMELATQNVICVDETSYHESLRRDWGTMAYYDTVTTLSTSSECTTVPYIDESSFYLLGKRDYSTIVHHERLFVDSLSSRDVGTYILDEMSLNEVCKNEYGVTMDTKTQNYCSLSLDNSTQNHMVVDQSIGEPLLINIDNKELQLNSHGRYHDILTCVDLVSKDVTVVNIDESSFYEVPKNNSSTEMYCEDTIQENMNYKDKTSFNEIRKGDSRTMTSNSHTSIRSTAIEGVLICPTDESSFYSTEKKDCSTMLLHESILPENMSFRTKEPAHMDSISLHELTKNDCGVEVKCKPQSYCSMSLDNAERDKVMKDQGVGESINSSIDESSCFEISKCDSLVAVNQEVFLKGNVRNLDESSSNEITNKDCGTVVHYSGLTMQDTLNEFVKISCSVDESFYTIEKKDCSTMWCHDIVKVDQKVLMEQREQRYCSISLSHAETLTTVLDSSISVDILCEGVKTSHIDQSSHYETPMQDIAIGVSQKNLTIESMSSKDARASHRDETSFHEVSRMNSSTVTDNDTILTQTYINSMTCHETINNDAFTLPNCETSIKEKMSFIERSELHKEESSFNEISQKDGSSLSEGDIVTTQGTTTECIAMGYSDESSFFTTQRKDCSTMLHQENIFTESLSSKNEEPIHVDEMSLHEVSKNESAVLMKSKKQKYCSVSEYKTEIDSKVVDQSLGESMIDGFRTVASQHGHAQIYAESGISRDMECGGFELSSISESSHYELPSKDSFIAVNYQDLLKENGSFLDEILRQDCSTTAGYSHVTINESVVTSYSDDGSFYVIEKKDCSTFTHHENVLTDSMNSRAEGPAFIDGMSLNEIVNQHSKVTIRPEEQQYCSISLDNSGSHTSSVDQCVGESTFRCVTNSELQHDSIQRYQGVFISHDMHSKDIEVSCIDASSCFVVTKNDQASLNEISKEDECLGINIQTYPYCSLSLSNDGSCIATVDQGTGESMIILAHSYVQTDDKSSICVDESFHFEVTKMDVVSSMTQDNFVMDILSSKNEERSRSDLASFHEIPKQDAITHCVDEYSYDTNENKDCSVSISLDNIGMVHDVIDQNVTNSWNELSEKSEQMTNVGSTLENLASEESEVCRIHESSFYELNKKEASSVVESKPHQYCSMLVSDDGSEVGRVDECNGESIIEMKVSIALQQNPGEKLHESSMFQEMKVDESKYSQIDELSCYEIRKENCSVVTNYKVLVLENLSTISESACHINEAAFHEISKNDCSTAGVCNSIITEAMNSEDFIKPYIHQSLFYEIQKEDGCVMTTHEDSIIEIPNSLDGSKKDCHITAHDEILITNSINCQTEGTVYINGLSVNEISKNEFSVTMKTAPQHYCSVSLHNTAEDLRIKDECVGESTIVRFASIELQHSPAQKHQETEISVDLICYDVKPVSHDKIIYETVSTQNTRIKREKSVERLDIDIIHKETDRVSHISSSCGTEIETCGLMTEPTLVRRHLVYHDSPNIIVEDASEYCIDSTSTLQNTMSEIKDQSVSTDKIVTRVDYVSTEQQESDLAFPIKDCLVFLEDSGVASETILREETDEVVMNFHSINTLHTIRSNTDSQISRRIDGKELIIKNAGDFETEFVTDAETATMVEVVCSATMTEVALQSREIADVMQFNQTTHILDSLSCGISINFEEMATTMSLEISSSATMTEELLHYREVTSSESMSEDTLEHKEVSSSSVQMEMERQVNCNISSTEVICQNASINTHEDMFQEFRNCGIFTQTCDVVSCQGDDPSTNVKDVGITMNIGITSSSTMTEKVLQSKELIDVLQFNMESEAYRTVVSQSTSLEVIYLSEWTSTDADLFQLYPSKVSVDVATERLQKFINCEVFTRTGDILDTHSHDVSLMAVVDVINSYKEQFSYEMGDSHFQYVLKERGIGTEEFVRLLFSASLDSKELNSTSVHPASETSTCAENLISSISETSDISMDGKFIIPVVENQLEGNFQAIFTSTGAYHEIISKDEPVVIQEKKDFTGMTLQTCQLEENRSSIMFQQNIFNEECNLTSDYSNEPAETHSKQVAYVRDESNQSKSLAFSDNWVCATSYPSSLRNTYSNFPITSFINESFTFYEEQRELVSSNSFSSRELSHSSVHSTAQQNETFVCDTSLAVGTHGSCNDKETMTASSGAETGWLRPLIESVTNLNESYKVSIDNHTDSWNYFVESVKPHSLSLEVEDFIDKKETKAVKDNLSGHEGFSIRELSSQTVGLPEISVESRIDPNLFLYFTEDSLSWYHESRMFEESSSQTNTILLEQWDDSSSLPDFENASFYVRMKGVSELSLSANPFESLCWYEEVKGSFAFQEIQTEEGDDLEEEPKLASTAENQHVVFHKITREDCSFFGRETLQEFPVNDQICQTDPEDETSIRVVMTHFVVESDSTVSSHKFTSECPEEEKISSMIQCSILDGPFILQKDINSCGVYCDHVNYVTLSTEYSGSPLVFVDSSSDFITNMVGNVQQIIDSHSSLDLMSDHIHSFSFYEPFLLEVGVTQRPEEENISTLSSYDSSTGLSSTHSFHDGGDVCWRCAQTSHKDIKDCFSWFVPEWVQTGETCIGFENEDFLLNCSTGSSPSSKSKVTINETKNEVCLEMRENLSPLISRRRKRKSREVSCSSAETDVFREERDSPVSPGFLQRAFSHVETQISPHCQSRDVGVNTIHSVMISPRSSMTSLRPEIMEKVHVESPTNPTEDFTSIVHQLEALANKENAETVTTHVCSMDQDDVTKQYTDSVVTHSCEMTERGRLLTTTSLTTQSITYPTVCLEHMEQEHITDDDVHDKVKCATLSSMRKLTTSQDPATFVDLIPKRTRSTHFDTGDHEEELSGGQLWMHEDSNETITADIKHDLRSMPRKSLLSTTSLCGSTILSDAGESSKLPGPTSAKSSLTLAQNSSSQSQLAPGKIKSAKSMSNQMNQLQLRRQSEREEFSRSILERIHPVCDIISRWCNDSTHISSVELNMAREKLKEEWFKIAVNMSTLPYLEEFIRLLKAYHPLLIQKVVNMTDEKLNTALHYACGRGAWSVVADLLRIPKVEVNKFNKTGYTPLMLASYSKVEDECALEVARRLLQLSDVNLRAENERGETALLLASQKNNLRLIRGLFEYNVDVNASDKDGNTALIWASECGLEDLVKLLLKHPQIDCSLRDANGKTAYQIAMEKQHHGIALYIYSKEQLSHSMQRKKSQRRHHSASSSPVSSNRGPPRGGAGVGNKGATRK